MAEPRSPHEAASLPLPLPLDRIGRAGPHWRLPPALVRAALAGHSALGLGLAALLYVVALSGTLILFVPEWDRWQQPQARILDRVDPALAQRALEQLPGEPTTWRRVTLNYPTPALPRLVLSAQPAHGPALRYAADAGGALVPLPEPWSTFLHGLHERWMLPGTAGFLLVGILGVGMLALTLGGVLAHPRLFRDAFRFRAAGGERPRQTDLHNRLSVWPLPFHAMIAFTGAALGLALPASALIGRWGHHIEPAAVFTLFLGPAAGADRRVTALPDLPAILRQVDGGDPAAIQRVVVFEPGRGGQLVRVDVDRPRRLVYGDRLFFDARGASIAPGGLLDQRPGLPFYNGLFALHFGSYGGTPLRALYGVLGLALCAVVSSGVRVWLARQRARGRAWPRIEQSWVGWVWGSALALAGSFAAALAGGPLGSEPAWVFWGVLALTLLLALGARDPARLRRGLRASLGALLALIALVIAVAPT